MKTTAGWDAGMKFDRVMLEMVTPGSLFSKLVTSLSTEVLKVECVLPKSIGKVGADSLEGTCVGVSGGAISSRMDGLSSSSLRKRMVGFTLV